MEWRLRKEGKTDNNVTGRCPNGFLGLSLNDWTVLFLVILLDKTVFELGRSPNKSSPKVGLSLFSKPPIG